GHDPAGNLLMQDRPGPDIVAGNRLMIQGDHHYDYDAFGNLIRERRGKGHQLVTEYRYDCQHRLISITKPNGQNASYRYDPFGRRISKTVDGITTEFFWQGDKLVAEHHADRHRSYLYEPDSFRPLVLLEGFGPQDTQPFHYQLDHLGTPQELTAPDGEIVWSAHYRAYGDIARLDISKVDNPLRFQGQYFDQESGLHYNRHRYYNPDIGRYLTPDPVKLAGGINAYQYVPNPTGWVDPLGLSNCPGGDGCKPRTKADDPSYKSGVGEGQPSAPLIHDVDASTLNRTHSIEGKRSTKRVEEIARNMRNTGYDKNTPIDVVEYNEQRYIVDGHHRASAARQTHTPVTIKLIQNIGTHESSFSSTKDVIDASNAVGLDRLKRPRR
ncbi:RHS repeat-associated core domain-containing protein, partial [Pseudomonas antarctica]|uniref:RHS repeat-associated core domain-containing protein n=1 Tax=Pseudomonas antarctica TaxID=219572 RepID=UPI0039C06BE6